MKPESKLRERIVRALRSRGARVVVVHQDGHSAGELDLDVIYRGRAIKLEVKTPENTDGATALQRATIQEVRDVNGVAAVVRSTEEALRVLKFAVDDFARMESGWVGFWKWYENEGAQ